MKLLLWDADLLRSLREKLAAGAVRQVSALGVLTMEADAALKRGPYSVMDKTRQPASGNKHDYLSFGTYWWPNPDTEDHLPYVRRDGERNPEFLGDVSDTDALQAMCADALTLTLAAYYTDHQHYAEHAALLLRTWFIEPETRMNPHLEYGQAIPGICEGRGTGIIDTSQVLPLLDCVVILVEMGALSAEDLRSFKAWCSAYLHWLCDSEKGHVEHAHPNNHGTWCSAQMVGLALFTGNRPLAEQVLEQSITLHFEPYIAADGRQPEELARTRGFSYSKFNLRGMITLAVLAESTAYDLWHYVNAKGGSIAKAVQWLAPFANPATPWAYQQITEMDRGDLLPLLLQADGVFPEAGLRAAIAQLPLDDACGHRAWLMYDHA